MPTPQKPMAIKLPDNNTLDREEAVERFREESNNRWEEYRQTGSTVSNEAVMEWLESCFR